MFFFAGKMPAVFARQASPNHRLENRIELDTNPYPAVIKVSDEKFEALNIRGGKFHSDWNYRLLPAP